MRLDVCFYYIGNIQRATEIYSRFLGASPIYADDDWVRFHVEGGDLALHYSSDVIETDTAAPVKYGAIVSFTVEDMHNTLAHAVECGFRPNREVREQPFGKLSEIRDPWGNRISLLEPSAERAE